MILTPEEYARGLVRWTEGDGCQFWTQSGEASDRESDWEGPLVESPGSIVSSPTHSVLRINGNLIRDTNFPIRWEREHKHAIVTHVWDQLGPSQRLLHLPRQGIFHRLVTHAQFLAWPEDLVITGADSIIRFTTQRVLGEKIEPIDQVIARPGNVSFIGQPSGSAWAQGRMIEICAPGQTPHDAEQNAFAALALVALIVGDHAIGPIVFSEPYEATKSGQNGELRIPVRALLPREAASSEFELLDSTLPEFLGDGRLQRARRFALRWYERGLRAETPLDKVVSYFIGIETVLTAFAAERGPLPIAEDRRQQVEPILLGLRNNLDGESFAQLTQRLLDTTVTEKFDFYSGEHPSLNLLDRRDAFRAALRIRNGSLHGDLIEVSDEDDGNTKELLVDILRDAFGFTEPPVKVPQVVSLKASYTLVDDGAFGPPAQLAERLAPRSDHQ